MAAERFFLGRQLKGHKLCLFVVIEIHVVALFRHGRHDVVLHAALLEPAGGGGSGPGLGAVPHHVPDPAALVAGLGSAEGAVPHHVPHLVAVVARVLLLGAGPGHVAAAVALVASLLFLAALPGKVPEPVALVALAASSAVTSAASTLAISSVSLGALAGKVTSTVTPSKLQ